MIFLISSARLDSQTSEIGRINLSQGQFKETVYPDMLQPFPFSGASFDNGVCGSQLYLNPRCCSDAFLGAAQQCNTPQQPSDSESFKATCETEQTGLMLCT